MAERGPPRRQIDPAGTQQMNSKLASRPHTSTVLAASADEGGRPWLTRIRVQLLGGLVLGVLMPAAVRWDLLEAGMVSPGSSLGNSLWGTALAVIVGYMFLRQLAAYPGVRPTTYILPVFAITFGALSLLMFGLRLDYSRYQLLASFALTLSWYYWVFLTIRQRNLPRIAIVPGGNHRGIDRLPGVHWTRLDRPALADGAFDAIAADTNANLPAEWERFLMAVALKGVPVYPVKQVVESLTGRIEVEHLSENTFGSILPSLPYRKAKTLADTVAALVLLPVLMPVLALVALAIRLESPGPALFRQRRIGLGGHPFTIYKFRTMRQRGHGETGPHFTSEEDDRVTRLGRFLRKYRIDELPQIINILKGEMSWIGPRPEAIELAEWYEREIPFYGYRHLVRPGITGWAQVNQGNVAEVDAATSKLHYDFYYIKNFSLWLDVLIVARTVYTILTGFGSR